MTRSRLRRFAVPAALVALVVALTLFLLYNEPLRRAILEPVTWILNDIRHALAPLPQALLWAIGLLVGCAVLLVSWRRALRCTRSRPARTRRFPVKPHNANAIATLATDLHRARKHHVSRSRIVRELAMLAERMIAKREGIGIDQARQMIHSGEWPADPEMRRFFASRRTGAAAIPKQQFLEAVETALQFLDRYYQEV